MRNEITSLSPYVQVNRVKKRKRRHDCSCIQYEWNTERLHHKLLQTKTTYRRRRSKVSYSNSKTSVNWREQCETDTHLPVRSSNMSIPRDQRSTEKSWPLLSMISGATYSGVPQKVHVLRPCPIFFAKPKSTYMDKFTSKIKRMVLMRTTRSLKLLK